VSAPANDPRIAAILTACYEVLDAGGEPDLAVLCANAPGLRTTIDRMLRRQREVEAACLASRAHPPSPVDHLPPMPGQLGEFTILEPIGIGGMSIVYRARQEPLGREVALKVLRPELVTQPTSRLRFAREAAITAALEHPHIVPIHGAGEHGGHVYLAMRLLRGQSLDRRSGQLSARDVARIGAEAASALQAAHEVGVVHRDVKPANIVDEEGRTFVVDFGLAAFANQASTLTQPDSTPGTLVYLPPEVVSRRGGDLDVRIDVYGLGATLHELLAGRPPFDAENPVRALHQILHQDPPSLGLRGRDLDLETIVQKAMEKSPQRRFQTAREMQDELQRFLAGLPIHSRRISPPERLWRTARRHPTIAALTGAVVVLAAAMFGFFVLASHERATRIAHSETVVAAALARGDIARAEAGVEALLQAGAEPESVAARRSSIARERCQQLLFVALLNPTMQRDEHLVESLVQQIDSDRAANGCSPQCEALLAIASRAATASPVAHRHLDRVTRSALPRTTLALDAWSRHDDPSTVLANAEAGGAAHDHLLAALVLRVAQSSPRAMETELRMAANGELPLGAKSFALSAALESQSRYETAYDLLQDLGDDPVFAIPAAAASARLAAHLGRHDDAARHLHDAIEGARGTNALESIVIPTELDVLVELGRLDEFWARWREAKPRFQHLAQYWLRGGYAACDDPRGNPEGAALAREYFATGLQRDPDPPRRGALEVALLQLEFASSIAVTTTDPLDDTPELQPERDRLRALALRAEATAEAAQRANLSVSLQAAALLVAARAWRAVGDRVRSWRILENTCIEHGEPEALAQFAHQTAYRIALERLAPGTDADAAAGPIDAAAARALGYARIVTAPGRLARPVVPELIAQTEHAALLCAFQLGEAETALPLAVRLAHEVDSEEPVAEIARRCIDWGGADIDRDDWTWERKLAIVERAAKAVRSASVRGNLDNERCLAIVRRWREALRPDLPAAEAARLDAALAPLEAPAERRR